MKKHNTQKASIAFIVITVTLDAMGIGLIMPVLPDLIIQITSSSMADAAYWGGWLGSSYALMQFLFGPFLGNLSDRFGRRPILINSLVFMSLNYLFMAFAGNIVMLFIGRLLSGISGATYATANAFLADISEKGQRAKHFGLVGAAFGLGFVLGPALGGFLGEIDLRLPFFVAGALALANAMFGVFILPETLNTQNQRKFEWRRCNPFRSLLRLHQLPAIGSLMLVLLIYSIANNVYPSIWAYFLKEQFTSSLTVIGISLTIYGLSSALVQIFLLRYMISRFGEERTILYGVCLAILSLLTITQITSNIWLLIGFLPIIAISAVVAPSIQGLVSEQTNQNEQGELQGIYTSIVAIATIISPLLMTNVFYFFTTESTPYYLPSAPFVMAAFLASLALLILQLTGSSRKPQKVGSKN